MSWSTVASSNRGTIPTSGAPPIQTTGPSTAGADAALAGKMSELQVRSNASNAYAPARTPAAHAALYAASTRAPTRNQHQNSGQKFLDPSAAPSPSVASTSRPMSTASSRPYSRWFKNKVCKYFPDRTAGDFRKGDVISLPFHQANSNPNADEMDPNLTFSHNHGAIYSKRRMVVVLYIHRKDLFCLPLYSWNGKGVTNKPRDQMREYNSTDGNNFHNQGVHKPVVIEKNKYPLTPATTVALTAGLKVDCQEDIQDVGRLTEESYEHLFTLWLSLSEQARDQPWQD
ncbi:hypothetical protein LTR56_006887 [Elasticomyces elasticus]|nr:hypothetical protein LTR22_016572 [Elasticomyces elasticus]KAK3649411.1 hypothetical protein LTR56_006887 [Elasticomyces elasticus]KAK4928056.1 hypothetical protein LTR49_005255 [Elasticomyces elasticus]KAK5753361.1 hypothetical protein LTS12_016508 [Elasticomyces elasticus]